MSSGAPILLLVVVLALPFVAFYFTVESSRRRLLVSLHAAEQVEGVLAHKPWYVSRGQLVAWEYLVIEAEVTHGEKPYRHFSRIGPRGRRLWIVWQGVKPAPLFHPWTSAGIFALGGVILVLPAYRAGTVGLAIAEGLAVLGLCGYLLAAGRLQRGDEDWRIGAKLRPLLALSPEARIAGMRDLACIHLAHAEAQRVA